MDLSNEIVNKEGILKKQALGYLYKPWTDRLFKLYSRCCLLAYINPNDNKLRGLVKIENKLINAVSNDLADGKDHALIVYVTKLNRKVLQNKILALTLAAKTKEERNEWISAINNSIQSYYSINHHLPTTVKEIRSPSKVKKQFDMNECLKSSQLINKSLISLSQSYPSFQSLRLSFESMNEVLLYSKCNVFACREILTHIQGALSNMFVITNCAFNRADIQNDVKFEESIHCLSNVFKEITIFVNRINSFQHVLFILSNVRPHQQIFSLVIEGLQSAYQEILIEIKKNQFIEKEVFSTSTLTKILRFLSISLSAQTDQIDSLLLQSGNVDTDPELLQSAISNKIDLHNSYLNEYMKVSISDASHLVVHPHTFIANKSFRYIWKDNFVNNERVLRSQFIYTLRNYVSDAIRNRIDEKTSIGEATDLIQTLDTELIHLDVLQSNFVSFGQIQKLTKSFDPNLSVIDSLRSIQTSYLGISVNLSRDLVDKQVDVLEDTFSNPFSEAISANQVEVSLYNESDKQNLTNMLCTRVGFVVINGLTGNGKSSLIRSTCRDVMNRRVVVWIDLLGSLDYSSTYPMSIFPLILYYLDINIDLTSQLDLKTALSNYFSNLPDGSIVVVDHITTSAVRELVNFFTTHLSRLCVVIIASETNSQLSTFLHDYLNDYLSHYLSNYLSNNLSNDVSKFLVCYNLPVIQIDRRVELIKRLFKSKYHIDISTDDFANVDLLNYNVNQLIYLSSYPLTAIRQINMSVDSKSMRRQLADLLTIDELFLLSALFPYLITGLAFSKQQAMYLSIRLFYSDLTRFMDALDRLIERQVIRLTSRYTSTNSKLVNTYVVSCCSLLVNVYSIIQQVIVDFKLVNRSIIFLRSIDFPRIEIPHYLLDYLKNCEVVSYINEYIVIKDSNASRTNISDNVINQYYYMQLSTIYYLTIHRITSYSDISEYYLYIRPYSYLSNYYQTIYQDIISTSLQLIASSSYISDSASYENLAYEYVIGIDVARLLVRDISNHVKLLYIHRCVDKRENRKVDLLSNCIIDNINESITNRLTNEITNRLTIQLSTELSFELQLLYSMRDLLNSQMRLNKKIDKEIDRYVDLYNYLFSCFNLCDYIYMSTELHKQVDRKASTNIDEKIAGLVDITTVLSRSNRKVDRDIDININSNDLLDMIQILLRALSDVTVDMSSIIDESNSWRELIDDMKALRFDSLSLYIVIVISSLSSSMNIDHNDLLISDSKSSSWILSISYMNELLISSITLSNELTNYISEIYKYTRSYYINKFESSSRSKRMKYLRFTKQYINYLRICLNSNTKSNRKQIESELLIEIEGFIDNLTVYFSDSRSSIYLSELISVLHIQIVIYNRRGDLNSCVNNYLQIIKIRKEVSGNKDISLLSDLNALGHIYYELDVYDLAKLAYEEALNIYLANYPKTSITYPHNFFNILIILNTNLGNVNFTLNNYTVAQTHYDETIAAYERLNPLSVDLELGLAQTLCNLAKLLVTKQSSMSYPHMTIAEDPKILLTKALNIYQKYPSQVNDLMINQIKQELGDSTTASMVSTNKRMSVIKTAKRLFTRKSKTFSSVADLPIDTDSCIDIDSVSQVSVSTTYSKTKKKSIFSKTLSFIKH